MNRRLCALLSTLLFAQAATAEPLAGRPQDEWKNPSGTVTVTCGHEDVVTGDNKWQRDFWLINGTQAVWNTEPSIRRESIGTGHPLAPGDQSHWVDDRFLVFISTSREGVSVIDTSTREILLSHQVEACTAAPDGKSWAAIAYRSSARTEDRDGTETDTLRLIEPQAMARDLPKVIPHEAGYAHIPKVDLDGLAMTKPLWSADGKGVILVLATSDKVEAVRIDVAARRIARRIPLQKLKATAEELTSYTITPEIDARYQPALQSVLKEL